MQNVYPRNQIKSKVWRNRSNGHLYYGNYAQYYEVGRAEAIRALGSSYKELEARGIMMPVIKLESEYFRPAFYDDLITIKTRLEAIPEQSDITFISELFNEKGKLLNRGTVTLVFYDNETKKKTCIPNDLKLQLQQYF